MPLYEYEYTRKDGEVVRVAQVGTMDTASDPIEVVDKTDGNTYIAERILSLTANMHLTWDADVIASDLPPVNYGPEDVKRDREAKKGKKSTSKHAKGFIS